MAVKVGVTIGVCGSGVGVVPVAIIAVGVTVEGTPVCVPTGVGDGVTVAGTMVAVTVGAAGGDDGYAPIPAQGEFDCR